jgi:hypothetical protein
VKTKHRPRTSITNANLIKTIGEIDELRFRDDIEILPTEYARNMAIAIATETASYLPDCFFMPWITGNAHGGVRLIWARSRVRKEVRLIIPPDCEGKLSIYHESRNKEGMEFNVSAKMLSCWLQWLAN